MTTAPIPFGDALWARHAATTAEAVEAVAGGAGGGEDGGVPHST